MSDPEGRPTVASLVKDVPARVVPVGRLDRDTTGCLVLGRHPKALRKLRHPRRSKGLKSFME